MTGTSSGLDAILADRYRIERQIGQGGMATVYLADDLKLGRQVALKVLRSELGAVLGVDRFLAEVKITARLDHPHILTLIDSGNAGSLLYYVLPFVRGESLHDLLNREHQLGVEQALAITKQVASALDYAHRHGIVHRDIKPGNILLQEGEAMLADFGIALAVQASGGSRLTETGISLGTPHYMSPEQATGDRDLDARSDLYSLAAVLYEMLVGEPPITGKTVQAVIAKLLTESPTRIRAVRPAVAEHIDAAVMKALSKVPADRFKTVAEFSRVLEMPATAAAGDMAGSGTRAAAPRRSRRAFVAVGAAVLVVGAVAAYATRDRFGFADTSATLRDRSQLTFTGKVTLPTLSGDGKQLASFTRECTGATCIYAIDVQDVGSTTTRRVLDGATAASSLAWSPDRRNLLMSGTIGGRVGTFLIPVLGGAPRFLTTGAAEFFAGGDSLFIGDPGASDSSFTVHIAGLDGTVRDSVRVAGPGEQLGALVSIPGSSRFVSLVIQSPNGLWQVHDRSGAVTDELLNSCTCGAVASHDALWMTRASSAAAEAVVRVALDPKTGKFATHQDTIYSGRFTNVSVTADGTRMAVDDGSFTYASITASPSELLRGAVAPVTPMLQASNRIGATVSPDGSRLLIDRHVPGAHGADETRLAIMPYAGGNESPLSITGDVVGARWTDSTSILVRTHTASGSRLLLTDIRSAATTRSLDLPDSTIASVVALPDGWAWIPKKRDRVIVEQSGKRHEIAKLPWYDVLTQVNASPDGARLLLVGWNAGSSDTVGVSVVPAAGGQPVMWTRSVAEGGSASWLADGAVIFFVFTGAETIAVHRVSGPGQDAPLGTIGHFASLLSVSRDFQHAALGWRDYRGDAWLYRVVKP